MSLRRDFLLNWWSRLWGVLYKRFVPSFNTLFLDVKGSVDEDLFVPDNPFSILLSVIRQEGATKAEFESALRRAVEALNHLSQDSPQWVRAVYYLVLMIYHKRPKEEHDPLREMVFEGIGERSQTKEVDQMSQTMAEYLMEQGEKRGRVHGEKRGEARGQLKAKREDILEILRLRFDTVPDAMERKIKSIRRLDRLDGLLKQAVTAESVSEIVMD